MTNTMQVHPLPVHGPRDGTRARRTPTRRRSQHQWESANRRGLLVVHAMVGLLAGLLILFNGTARSFEGADPWGRPVIGGLAISGGVVLLTGLLRRRRVMGLEVTGLVLLACWDLIMGAGFVIAAQSAGEIAFTWPWAAITDPSSPRLYPIVLYVGLFLMMCVHLVTLRHLGRASRLVEQRSRMRVAHPDELLG